MYNEYDNSEFFGRYAQMPRSSRGLSAAGEWSQLKGLFPDMDGRAVLDLGCGYGWHCRYALEQGAARVLGLDISENMLNEAVKRGGDGIEYRLCGIEEYEYPREEWDLAVSNLALHYIRDLQAVYQKVHRTLRPGGVFLFNIEHPVFTAGINEEWVLDGDGKPLYWPMDRYFFPGGRETVFLGQRVVKQHHTLTQILMGLLRAGFCLEAVEEAQPPEELLDVPGMADELRRPMMLLVRCRRGGE